MRLVLSGIAASRGLALGRARIREAHRLEIEERILAADEVDAEIARLHQAIAATRAELARLREQLQGALAQEIGEFLDLHALLLDDPDLATGLVELIRTGRYAANYALKLQRDRLAAVFDTMDDPYLRSRREDIDHVIGRVQAALLRGPESSDVIGLAGEVLVTDTVAPAELVQLSERGVVAVLVSQGSPLSHSAILARSLGLPMMIVPADALATIPDAAAVMVDAGRGEIIVEPGANDLVDLREREFAQVREQRTLARLRTAPTRTSDDTEIRLQANAESREDVTRAFRLGASGIGLYRTEFLFLQRREPPDEDEQLAAYRDAVLGMSGRPVTLRTLDLGADKADLAGIALAREPNPAMGLRGVRLALARPALFRIQLRAMLRASGYGPVRILVPMVTQREEMLAVRALANQYEQELRAEGHHVADNILLGAMIEIPAAAIVLPSMIDTMDFVSIGTNDLIQYLLAVDRGNDAIGALFSPLHPAVIRVLHEIVVACGDAGKPLSICGEIASDPHFTQLLLALGLTDFSMHPTALLEVRARIRQSDLRTLRRRRTALLRAQDRAALERIVNRF
ncbi:phosphoenolpyruvate--protein phosphotransferase [Xanthomonadaceae bacterium XH05]|nr:phosphoenolpyruvate--protein phosphotransferase [Xanthomonadaceae bacterium XH05]